MQEASSEQLDNHKQLLQGGFTYGTGRGLGGGWGEGGGRVKNSQFLTKSGEKTVTKIDTKWDLSKSSPCHFNCKRV